MPRSPRYQPPGFFHVISRGVDGRVIFLPDDDDTRELYLQFLTKCVRRHGVVCHRYCLMDNHIHLVLQTAPLGNSLAPCST
jgi:putative transposase